MLNNIVALLGNGSGGGATSFESIATANGTGSSGTITFSSIPSTYKHLQVRCLTSSTISGDYYMDINMRFNSDNTSNYNQHWLYGDGSTLNYGGQATNTAVVAVSGDVNYKGVNIVDIHDYADTSKLKTIRSLYGVDRNGSGYIGLRSNLWRSTSAITSITISCGDNFSSDNVFALYGIKGA